jgi:hypothetical protein
MDAGSNASFEFQVSSFESRPKANPDRRGRGGRGGFGAAFLGAQQRPRAFWVLADDRRPKPVLSGVEGDGRLGLVRTSFPPFAQKGAQRMGHPKVIPEGHPPAPLPALKRTFPPLRKGTCKGWAPSRLMVEFVNPTLKRTNFGAPGLTFDLTN